MTEKSKKSETIKSKKLSARQLLSEILRLFKYHQDKRYSAKQIIEKLKIDNNKDSVTHALGLLAAEGKLIANAEDGKFALHKANLLPIRKGTERLNYIGTVDITRSGSAYIVCDGLENDPYVNPKALNGALHGDKVKVAVFTPRGRNKAEGEVLEVVVRASEYFMGTIKFGKKYAVVAPDRLNMSTDIYVYLDDIKGAQDGDKVVVKITKWPVNATKSPIGIVTTVLGSIGSSDIEMKSILINNGFNIEFPPEVLEVAEAISTEITETEIANRRDYRNVLTFTIDPEDAKDFDDAISYQILENGNTEIGVHIADVAHYLEPDTALDKEAFRRSTSVYLVDRVCPMLPERLSNELCSLRPHEDKYTFSAVFEFDAKGIILNRWFGRTAIHSNRRFTYEEAQQVLETGEGDYADELKKCNVIALQLRKEKYKNGAINFESEEVRFRLDETGAPIDVYVKERKEAHLLIEDFMLLANREVATFIIEKGKKAGAEIPFIYRIHDTPNMDKLADFALFALGLGFKMDLQTPEKIATSFNALAEATKENDAFKVLESLAIRTMAKAVYSPENIGHYGLAFKNYTHFTSPIRRYSDVVAHRILAKNLGDAIYRENNEKLEEKCKHISAQERKAMDAERESIKYKQVEFIKAHVGDVFPGIVSGFMERGLFVELLHNKCEGMIPFNTLNEPFELTNGRLQIKGRHSGLSIKMGDTVNVRVISADLIKRQIEMELVS